MQAIPAFGIHNLEIVGEPNNIVLLIGFCRKNHLVGQFLTVGDIQLVGHFLIVSNIHLVGQCLTVGIIQFIQLVGQCLTVGDIF